MRSRHEGAEGITGRVRGQPWFRELRSWGRDHDRLCKIWQSSCLWPYIVGVACRGPNYALAPTLLSDLRR